MDALEVAGLISASTNGWIAGSGLIIWRMNPKGNNHRPEHMG